MLFRYLHLIGAYLLLLLALLIVPDTTRPPYHGWKGEQDNEALD